MTNQDKDECKLDRFINAAAPDEGRTKNSQVKKKKQAKAASTRLRMALVKRRRYRQDNPKILRAICLLLASLQVTQTTASSISGTGDKMANSNNQINQRTLAANQQMAMAMLLGNGGGGGGGGRDSELPYKCAKYCTCSLVQTLDSSKGALVNLTRASCESPLFSDVLTIDRRTQIIHISLPADESSKQQQQQSNEQSTTTTTTSSSSISKRKQLELMTKLLNLNVTGQQQAAIAGNLQPAQAQFRMPRLMQFYLLQEIVIINLRIEVCDSEIFKRNQRLHKLKWNYNQLRQLSKNCFKHLDKLLELNLDYNQLDELESALFSPLISLRHLSLAHNQLSELTAHQFANLTQLQSLNLVGNSFKTINLNLFEPMQNSLQLLILAKNQIRQFVVSAPTLQITQQQQQIVNPLAGVIFRNLIKLNVDYNKFERVKLLQLHRFFNVKFLSARGNNIASIRDKAFNGLKLVELNLAQNKLLTISRCAFCNSTIKRLNLAENNISMPLLAGGSSLLTGTPAGAPPPPLLLAAATTSAIDAAAQAPSAQQLVAQEQPPSPPPHILNPPASSASMLVLSQSILGPLFGHLEYLDLSQNTQLASQLEFLLEPLLELQYLNLAAIGLDRTLPTPTLFKNLRHLRYLNLSMNHLDQLVAETIEPLVELELLDMSQNDFSELDESFLVVMEELPMLKFVNLASNPWYCSQCKISPLYDWILRSPIYNSTCIAQQQQQQLASSGQDQGLDPLASVPNSNDAATDDQVAGEMTQPSTQDGGDSPTVVADGEQQDLSLGFIYRHQGAQTSDQTPMARGPHDYSLLGLGGDSGHHHLTSSVDFELILDLFEGDSSSSMLSALDEMAATTTSGGVPNYQFVSPGTDSSSSSLQSQFRDKKRQLSRLLLKSLASQEDDNSIARTISSVPAAAQIVSGQLDAESSESLLKRYFAQVDFCLKCEFPSELRSFNLHELAPADFKYCAGSAPRFAASEPKIGLTLAIVIIGALFVLIIVVIVVYRKKSNTYFPGEDLTEQLEDGQHLATGVKKVGGGGNQPVLSISSDVDHQYGDNTDYSSPPMSQSYSGGEDSYTDDASHNPDDDDDDLNEDEDEYDDDEEEDDEEEDGEEENDDDDEYDEDDDDDFGENDDDDQGGPPSAGAAGPSDADLTGGGAPPPPSSAESPGDHNSRQQQQHKTRFDSSGDKPRPEETQTEALKAQPPPAPSVGNINKKQTKSRQPSRELSTSRSKSTTSGGGGGAASIPPSAAPSQASNVPSPQVAGSATPSSSATNNTSSQSLTRAKRSSLNRSQGSQGGVGGGGGGSARNRLQNIAVDQPPGEAAVAAATQPRQQLTHNDRDDSTPIYIQARKQQSDSVTPARGVAAAAAARELLSPSGSLERAAARAVSGATPASLSAADLLLTSGSTPPQPTDMTGSGSGSMKQHRSDASKLVELANMAGSLHESHVRASARAKRRETLAKSSPTASGGSTASPPQVESTRQKAPAGASHTPVAPKTILHNQVQTSEHVVSFAATPTNNYANSSESSKPPVAASEIGRRDRLNRNSQTICVDRGGGLGNRANYSATPTGGGGGGPSSRLGGARVHAKPRHQMSALAPESSGRDAFVAQVSNGHQRHQHQPATDHSPFASPMTPGPPIDLQRAQPRAVQKMVTPDTPTNTLTDGVPKPELPSSQASGTNARQVTSARGRHLVKQPHPHEAQLALNQVPKVVSSDQKLSESSQTGATRLAQQAAVQTEQLEQSVRFGEEEDDPDNNDDSLALEARLAELPSDLDETDLEQMLADNSVSPDNYSAASDNGGQHGGTLEFNASDNGDHARHEDDDDHDYNEEEEEEEEEERDNGAAAQLMSAPPVSYHMIRNSNSTHSALTQTGSRDFES